MQDSEFPNRKWLKDGIDQNIQPIEVDVKAPSGDVHFSGFRFSKSVTGTPRLSLICTDTISPGILIINEDNDSVTAAAKLADLMEKSSHRKATFNYSELNGEHRIDFTDLQSVELGMEYLVQNGFNKSIAAAIRTQAQTYLSNANHNSTQDFSKYL